MIAEQCSMFLVISKEDVFRMSTQENEIEPRKQELLELEVRIHNLTQDVKKSLHIEKAETEICIQKMVEIKSIAGKLTPMILKKNPNCVETMGRIQKYIGNLPKWNLTDNETEKFQKNAEVIRDLARDIYKTFEGIFNFPSKDRFWKQFTEMMAKFEERTSKLDDTFMSFLCFEEELENLEVV